MSDPSLQERKLLAEIAKLEAEAAQGRKTTWSRAGELLKVSAAVFSIGVASVAAVTTYKITQLEARLAGNELAQISKAKDVALAEARAATQQRDAAQRELAALAAEAERARREIAAVRTQPTTSPAVSSSLQRVDDRLAKATRTASRSMPHVRLLYADPAQERTARSALDGSFEIEVPANEGFGVEYLVTTEVRYFRTEDQGEAKNILRRLISDSVPSAKLRYVKQPQNRPPRFFEVAFAGTLPE